MQQFMISTRLTVLFVMCALTSFGSPSQTRAMQQIRPHDYALVFFFRSDCRYCHQFAPKLKQLAAQAGMYIYAFSLDNQGIPGFEVPIPVTPDIAGTFFNNPRNVTVPASFLINVNSRKFVRLTVGDVTRAQLQQSYHHSLNDPRVMDSLR